MKAILKIFKPVACYEFINSDCPLKIVEKSYQLSDHNPICKIILKLTAKISDTNHLS